MKQQPRTCEVWETDASPILQRNFWFFCFSFLKVNWLTLGRMSFSFFRTNRPSLSSLFQFSWTTSGFSSRSSWRSSNTGKQTGALASLLLDSVYSTFLRRSLWNLPPLTWTSYREYLGEDSILMSGLNFSAKVSMTSCVVAVLDTRMHFVAKLPATRSWK